MIRIVLGFGGFLLAFFPLRILFPLGQPLAVPVQAHCDGQGENFGRCPGGEGDDQGQHDPVVLTLIVAFPAWAPSKVFALPIAMRLYRNRQGLTKGKQNPKGKKGQKKSTKPKHDPNHRTRPELALELIIMVAQWFPNDEIIISGDSAYGGQSVLSHLPPNVHLISHVHPNGALYKPASPKK